MPSASRSTIDDFDTISSRTPIVADLRPGGTWRALQLYEAGGLGLVTRELIKGGLIDGSAPTVDGRTLAQVADAAVETPGQVVVTTIDKPLKATGGLAILRGSLAPDGCVIKLAGHERRYHQGPAKVFDSEKECFEAVMAQRIEPGDVVVIRYEGPVGGPGMQEMLAVTGALVGEGLGDSVGLLTDGRFSGGTHGLIDRPRGARGGAWRSHRVRARGRHHHHRRGQAPPRPRGGRRRAGPAPRGLDAARRPATPGA